jgi:glycosyltransferase involved in cell wall biosynthesis
MRRVGDVFRLAQVHFDLRRRFLPLQDRSAPPTLMHWTYPMPLYFCGVPNIYTVHDLIPLLHPALTGIGAPRMRRMFGQLRRRAAHLVTVSEASRHDIIRELGWPPDQVTNTYQAVLDAAPSNAAVAEVLAGLGLQAEGYVLHAGTVEPRKNLRRLIQAYRASGIPTPFVLAGPDGWHAAEELQGLADMPGLRRLPWVDRPSMLALLRGARFIAAPSLAEGFGLPVAEGMAFGRPVLTSGMGATAEVAGGAALLVDPRDGAALTAAMRALDSDPVLRADLQARGLRRSVLFSATAYAARLQRLYTGLVKESAAESWAR